jgi:hypothetical protein
MFVVGAVVAVGLVEVGTVLFSDRPQALRASIARQRANRQWSRHSRRRWRRQVRSTGMEIPTVELARLVPRDFLVSEYVRYQARGLWPWLEDALRLVMFIAAGVCGMALFPGHGSADWPVVLSCIGVDGVVAVMFCIDACPGGVLDYWPGGQSARSRGWNTSNKLSPYPLLETISPTIPFALNLLTYPIELVRLEWSDWVAPKPASRHG